MFADADYAGYLITVLVVHAPVLAVVVVGLVLTIGFRARIGGRSAWLGFSGFAALLLAHLASLAWSIMFTQLIRDVSVENIGILSTVVGVAVAILQVAGLGLLIAALVSRPARPA